MDVTLPAEERLSPRPDRVARRLDDLARCITGEVDIVERVVTLPSTGRAYRIMTPTEAGRERMFDLIRDHPHTPKPWWSKLWPSGVALADMVFERRDVVAGKRVLELGCGLGVTATAAIEAGAQLTVSDYSSLALAFCRYNALANTGRGPRTLRVNWREVEEGMLARVEQGGAFPLILAADVLYESTDIAPFLALVDRLLAPDGLLWLAEPGRKTSQRFLNMLAASGWEGESLTLAGPWPDDDDVEVGVHLLRRSAGFDELTGTLAGWRT